MCLCPERSWNTNLKNSDGKKSLFLITLISAHFLRFSPVGLPQVPHFCDPAQKDFKARMLLFPFFTSPLLRHASSIEKKDRNISGNMKIISTLRKRIPVKDFQRKTELLLPLNLIKSII
jgi:hypothetical protein